MKPFVNWALIGTGAAMILLEVLLGAITGFDFLLVGSALVLGGTIGLLTGNSVVGLACAGVLALLYVLVGRRRLRGRLRRPGISSNVDAIVGRLARVTETIGPHQPGRITIEGEEWRAVLDTTGHDGSPSAPGGAPAALSPGEVVRIVRIDGVTAHVATAASPPPPDPATA